MGQSFDVIVVGLGAMGSSTCLHLAKRGMRVLGVDRFSVPNTLGSSHGYSRAIRMAYYEHPDYVPLLRRAYALWHELEEVAGQTILHPTGGLFLGAENSELVRGSVLAAEEHHLAYEQLNRSDIQKRFPMFAVPDDYIGMYEPHAGMLRPELAVCTAVEAALHAGAELHGEEAVLGWSVSESGVQVDTSRGSYGAGQLVLCGGPWSSKLITDLGIELKVTRQVTGWVWPKEPALFQLGRFPVWAVDQGDGTLYYGFPMLRDNPGFKVAHHWHATQVDPDTVDRQPSSNDQDDFLPALKSYIPQADGPVLAVRVCLYTNSPDSHFIIDRHPVYSNVTVACGFSGHGFKFATVIGEAIADMVQSGFTQLPVGFLGLSRFSNGN